MPKEKCPQWLFNIYKTVYSSPFLKNALVVADLLSVAFCVIVFGVCLYSSFAKDAFEGITLIVGAASSFVAVSVMRRVINAWRPYQTYDLDALITSAPHRKSGSSFPSRHVFSSFLIGMIAFGYVPALGVIALALGLVLAVSRVCLGIHFIRDVVCGALIGIVSGTVLLFVL